MSKFKVGDWVQFVDADGTRYFGKCTGIRDTYHSDYGDITVVDTDWTDVGYFIQDIEYWQPKQGEWCWYVASGGFVKCLEYITENKFDGCYLGGSDATCYIQDCEPFVGKLPSFLKE